MIKNYTPYVGKIKLKFEKYPEYSGKDKLNKVHLDLGFTKLVSRITPIYLKEGGWKVDPSKIELIVKNTGGIIGTHAIEGWRGFDGEDCLLPNSFLSKSGKYIGDIVRAWWYYNNNMKVCEEYPHGVAEVIGKDGSIEGYYGYTHRGGQTFKIGDRLFEANYKPKEKDFEAWEWAGFVNKYDKTIMESKGIDLDWVVRSGIAYVIPYKKRGKKRN